MQNLLQRAGEVEDRESQLPSVPNYLLYGDSANEAEAWFLNIEPLGDRCRERGWKIEAHSHSRFAQMVFVRSGRGDMSIDDRSLSFESPGVLLVPVGSVHEISYEQDSDGWVLTIADFYLRQLTQRAPELASVLMRPDVCSISRDDEDAAELKAVFERLERELTHGGRGYLIAAETQLISILLVLLRRADAGAITALDWGSNQARLVDAYRQLVERHYRQGWKIPQFASELSVSVAQLRAACDAAAGMPPLKILQERILSEAKRSLIFSDMSVEQVAYWLGYMDPAYFVRVFKKELGQTPASYRKAMRRSEPANLAQKS